MSSDDFKKAVDQIEEEGTITISGYARHKATLDLHLSAIKNLCVDPDGNLDITYGNTIQCVENHTLDEVLELCAQKEIDFIVARAMTNGTDDNRDENLYFLKPEKYVICENENAPKGFSLQEKGYPEFAFYPVDKDLMFPLSKEECRKQWMLDEKELTNCQNLTV